MSRPGSGKFNPFSTHADTPTPGETVIEGNANAPIQYIPSSHPDLRVNPMMQPAAGTFPPTAMGPPQTLPPTGMRPPQTPPPTAMGSFRTLPPTAMESPRTRPAGSFPSARTIPPGSFRGAPPPSMPFHESFHMVDPNVGTYNPIPLFDDMKDGAPEGSFHGFYSSQFRYPVQNQQSWAAPLMASGKDSVWNADNRGRPRGPDQAINRYHVAGDRNELLEEDLNLKTGNAWKEYHQRHFSALAKAHLEDVDWRVPRVNYCKDPKWDAELPHQQRNKFRQAKRSDGANLEKTLGEKAISEWAEEHRGSAVPPEEMVLKPGVPFDAVHPGYRRWDDMWERELTLRNLGEAMNGDLHYPMPKPVLFGEDYQNFHKGRYLKDECPIA